MNEEIRTYLHPAPGRVLSPIKDEQPVNAGSYSLPSIVVVVRDVSEQGARVCVCDYVGRSPG